MKIVGLLLITLAVANAGVLYTRTVAPQGWRKSREASVQERVNFQLALRQQNLDQLEKIFHEVSDPSHPNYQNFLTPAQIQALVSPPAEEHQRVVDWLLQSGVKAENIKSFGDSIKASTTVMLAARMFSTSFFQYIHEDGRRLIAAHGDYSVPSHLEGLITMVTGLSHFPIPHLKWHKYDRTANPTPNADYGIIPQTLTGLYNIRPVVPGSALNTSQGVIEFEEQNFSPTDLDNYGKDLGIKIPPVSDEHTVGPNDPSAPSTEGQLDIEVIAGVNPESDNWFWFNSPSDKWLFEWITEFNAAADVPYIISVSYAWWEGDQCNPGISGDACSQMGVDSYGYARAVNTEFMKSGTRGITIFVASGDSGTNGRTDPSCTIPKLRPDFPACSPYVTSVGATELINAQPIPNAPAICKTFGGCAKSGTEQAVSYRISNYASGGGFSNTGAQPSWQKAAVSAYLSGGTTLPPASYYNASGRGFPDIAALGHQCVVVQYGQTEGVGGTSCAAPFVAGIFGLLNQYSFQKTGKPLGFVNPLIYQMFAADPTIFQDITVGDNKCTEEGCSPSCKGFQAAKGWDPVTGVGTPNFAKILKFLETQVFADK